MNRCFAFFISVLLSSTLSANTLVISEDTGDELKATIQSSWMHCEEQRWCADELYYYRESFIAEAQVTEQSLTVELFAEYSPHLLSQLQLHLRQDGFELLRVKIEGVEFDVASAVKESSLAEADRALILFLNRYPSSAERTLDWQSRVWHTQLKSDGELVSLTLTQRRIQPSEN